MSWLDRLQEAAYTSPSGIRTTFKYENVRANINKRDSIREFPDFAGALVQNFGIGAASFPLLCAFWGGDHDQKADAFLGLLTEAGKGILEHPLYGRFENIVAMGPIARRDDLKTAANQSIFEVNFVQSTEFQFPGTISSVSDQIVAGLDSFAGEQAGGFAEGIEIETAREKISLVDSMKAKLNSLKHFMGKITATVADIENEFQAGLDLIEEGIDILINQPLALASKIINLVTLPARGAAQISATLSAYQNLLTAVISDAEALFSPAPGNSVNNQFFSSELFASAAVAGMLTAAEQTGTATREITGQSLENFVTAAPEETPSFITKGNIVSTIEFLTERFSQLNDWNEANRASLNLLDTGEAYFYLNNARSQVAGFLVSISFSARQERILILGSPRHFIELCAELYGVVDNALDFFILTNELVGEEFTELPRGRRIRYYV